MGRFVWLGIACLLAACGDDDGGSGGGLCSSTAQLYCGHIPGTYAPCDSCPSGTTCYDQLCMELAVPACQSGDAQYAGWPDDDALEPNGHPDLAYVVDCGDDAVFELPDEYYTRCPSRAGYSIAPLSGVICEHGERDFYGVYLLPDEAVTVRVNYQYSPGVPRDIDARVWRWDYTLNDWREDVAVGFSTNDNEELAISTAAGSGNPQGWYYIEVFGKTYQDLNYYMLEVTLNP